MSRRSTASDPDVAKLAAAEMSHAADHLKAVEKHLRERIKAILRGEFVRPDGIFEDAGAFLVRWRGRESRIAPQEALLLRGTWGPSDQAGTLEVEIPVLMNMRSSAVWQKIYNPADRESRGSIYTTCSKLNTKLSDKGVLIEVTLRGMHVVRERRDLPQNSPRPESFPGIK